jgi:HlyD family secretion protein
MSSRYSWPAFVLVPLIASCSGEGDGAVDPSLIHTVRRSDLVITVREQGEIEAAKNTVIASAVDGQARLIKLIPQGSVVEAGDILAELDVSDIEEKRAAQAISVAKADAAREQARKNFAVMEKEIRAEEKTAENRLRIAKLRLEKFVGHRRSVTAGSPKVTAGTNAEMASELRSLMGSEKLADSGAGLEQSGLIDDVLELLGGEENLDLEMGEMSNQILRMIDEISLARADLALAKDTLGHSRNLAEKNFITKNELERDEISYVRQLSRVTLAWNDLQLLIKYTLPENKIVLEQEVENARLGLESVIATGEARRVREGAELRSVEAEYTLAKERLDNWNLQIRNAIIRAPVPGLVVYAAQRGRRTRVRLGIDVNKSQELVVLPDVSTMVARLMVHEAQIGMVTVGQRAIVKLDAFPGEGFEGRVSGVSSLPDASSRWSNRDLKVYETTVLLLKDNRDGALRPGMTATIEIKVGVLQGVLNIPLLAVKRRGSASYVFRATPKGPAAVEVDLGKNNLTHVEILSGLAEGDRVYLVDPPGGRLPVPAPAGAGPEEARPVEAGPGSAGTAQGGPGGGAGG